MKTSFIKKFFFVLGLFFLLIVSAAILLPFVVPVDKYRPYLVTKANEQINGTLDIGRLDLSLWGKLQVKIDGLKLSDAQKRPVLSVQDAQVVLPWFSLLKGKPELQFVLKQPRIQIVSQADGKMNLATLVKDQPAADASAPSNSATQSPSGTSAAEIPAFALAAKLTLVLDKAAIEYSDEKTKDRYSIEDLNFVLKNVSLSSRMPFELSASTNLVLQKTIKVSGPVFLKGSVLAKVEQGVLQKTELSMETAVFDQLEIDYPGTFTKKKSVPLNASFSVISDPQKIEVSGWRFKVAELELSGKAGIVSKEGVQNIDLSGKTETFRLAALSEILPAMKAYAIDGSMNASFRVSGPTSKIGYQADVTLSKVRITHEALNQPLQLDGDLKIETDQIKAMNIKMASQGFDLTLRGALEGFSTPRFQFEAMSNQTDLDALLKASSEAETKRKQQAKSQAAGEPVQNSASAKTPAVDYNAMVMPMRQNPILANAAGTIGFNFSKVKATGVQIDQVQGKLALANLQLSLKDFSAKLFDGSLAGAFSFDMKPTKPKVALDFTLKNLHTKKMLESQMPFARNTVKGVISGNLNVGGNGLNSADITQEWKGNGTFGIQDAIFSTLDVGKQIREGFVEKLPPPARSQVRISDKMVDWRGEYKDVSIKYALDSGEFRILNLSGKALPGKGMDVNGNGKVRLENYGLEMQLEFIDTYQMLNADKLGKDPKYGHFVLPTKLGGTLFSPKFDWAYAASRLAKNAVKEKVQEKAKEALQKVVPGLSEKPNAKEAVKAFKGLFKR